MSGEDVSAEEEVLAEEDAEEEEELLSSLVTLITKVISFPLYVTFTIFSPSESSTVPFLRSISKFPVISS